MAEPKAYPSNPTIGPYISGPERFMKSKEERRSGLPRIYVRACIRKRGVEGECRINSALYAITHKTPLRLYSHLLRKFPYGNAHTTNPINFILITASSSTRRLLLFRRRRIDWRFVIFPLTISVCSHRDERNGHSNGNQIFLKYPQTLFIHERQIYSLFRFFSFFFFFHFVE